MNWTVDPKHTKDDMNTVALYTVTWDWTNKRRQVKRTGNAWTSRTKAESVYAEKLAAGLNPSAAIQYVGGFL